MKTKTIERVVAAFTLLGRTCRTIVLPEPLVGFEIDGRYIVSKTLGQWEVKNDTVIGTFTAEVDYEIARAALEIIETYESK